MLNYRIEKGGGGVRLEGWKRDREFFFSRNQTKNCVKSRNEEYFGLLLSVYWYIGYIDMIYIGFTVSYSNIDDLRQIKQNEKSDLMVMMR
jgi:hypothetical protein